MDRRKLLKIGAASSLLPFASYAQAPYPDSPKKRTLRIAHITDVHMHNNPEDPKNAARGLEKCLHHIQGLPDKADIIFNGGDSIDDALDASRSKVKSQWKLWHQVMQGENTLEVVDCIGNHDIWGSGPTQDPLYGKQWAMEEMGLTSRYQSFDRAGWHFIVLDSTYQTTEGWYTAKLDEEQFAWLKDDLANTPNDRPVLVFSHIPILCAAAFFDGDNEKSGNWVIPGAWVHIDARRIVELFHQHQNVKVCISGHIHLLDRVEYNQVTYYCNGAVSGNWWRGNYHQTPPGFAMLNLYDDGSFEREYISYV